MKTRLNGLFLLMIPCVACGVQDATNSVKESVDKIDARIASVEKTFEKSSGRMADAIPGAYWLRLLDESHSPDKATADAA